MKDKFKVRIPDRNNEDGLGESFSSGAIVDLEEDTGNFGPLEITDDLPVEYIESQKILMSFLNLSKGSQIEVLEEMIESLPDDSRRMLLIVFFRILQKGISSLDNWETHNRVVSLLAGVTNIEDRKTITESLFIQEKVLVLSSRFRKYILKHCRLEEELELDIDE